MIMTVYSLPYFQHLKETEHTKKLFDDLLSKGRFDDLIECVDDDPFKTYSKFLYSDGLTSRIKVVGYGNGNYKFNITVGNNTVYFNINKPHKKITEFYLNSPFKTNDFKEYKKHIYKNLLDNKPESNYYQDIRYIGHITPYTEQRFKCLGYFTSIPEDLKTRVMKTTGFSECLWVFGNALIIMFYYNQTEIYYFPYSGNWYSSDPVIKYDDRYLDLHYFVKE